MIVESVVQLYTQIIAEVTPIAFTLWVSDLVVKIIMTAATGGYLTTGAGRIR